MNIKICHPKKVKCRELHGTKSPVRNMCGLRDCWGTEQSIVPKRQTMGDHVTQSHLSRELERGVAEVAASLKKNIELRITNVEL